MKRPSSVLIASLVLLLGFAAVALAEEKASPAEPAPEPAAVKEPASMSQAAKPSTDQPANLPPVGQAGLTVVLDPETGELRAPTPEEIAATVALKGDLSRSTKGLKAVEHKNGMVTMDLKGRFRATSVAKPNADGNLTVKCSEHDHDKEAEEDNNEQ